MTVAALPRTVPARRTLTLRSRKYVAAFRVSLLGQIAYPAELALRTIFVFIIMFIFSSLWHTTYNQLGATTLGGFTLSQMLWYLALTESVMLSRPRDAIRIDEEVRTGQLAYQLTRPYSYLLYRFMMMCGERLPRFIVTLVIAGALATLFSGGVGVSWRGALAGLPVLALALTIDYLFVLGIGLLAFWAEDTSSFLFIYDRFLMILGGMMLPLTLLPGVLEQIANVLPFSAIVYAPASVFVAPGSADVFALVLRQGVWLLVAAALSGMLFRYAVRRLQTNGG
jgi:ABC-2 type transport system permease protein